MGKGGEVGGTIEVADTGLEQAKAYFQKRLGGTPLEAVIETLAANYPRLAAKVAADQINIDRKDMPVIDRRHVAMLRHDLSHGRFSVHPPYDGDLVKLVGDRKDPPVPEREQMAASPEIAAAWEKSGHRHRDKVPASYKRIAARDLSPIQRQVYLDKILDRMLALAGKQPEHPKGALKDFLAGATLVTSAGHEIIDGDHRWGLAMLVEPNTELRCLAIDLPLTTLLKVSLAFTELIGNQPNK